MGRKIPSDSVTTGRNAEYPSYDDHRYVKCKHCGFICHLDRDAKFPRGSKAGDGLSHPSVAEYDESTVTYDGTDDDWDETVGYDGYRSNFTVNMGCPFCGCLIYYE